MKSYSRVSAILFFSHRSVVTSCATHLQRACVKRASISRSFRTRWGTLTSPQPWIFTLMRQAIWKRTPSLVLRTTWRRRGGRTLNQLKPNLNQFWFKPPDITGFQRCWCGQVLHPDIIVDVNSGLKLPHPAPKALCWWPTARRSVMCCSSPRWSRSSTETLENQAFQGFWSSIFSGFTPDLHQLIRIWRKPMQRYLSEIEGCLFFVASFLIYPHLISTDYDSFVLLYSHDASCDTSPLPFSAETQLSQSQEKHK